VAQSPQVEVDRSAAEGCRRTGSLVILGVCLKTQNAIVEPSVASTTVQMTFPISNGGGKGWKRQHDTADHDQRRRLTSCNSCSLSSAMSTTFLFSLGASSPRRPNSVDPVPENEILQRIMG
jgi:hypothetical protein